MLKYFYITNQPDVARVADFAGVDRIFIDLEKNGKAERQPMDTVKNYHTLDDVKAVRPSVKNAELLVRVNPVFEGTQAEIDTAIEYGADIIMLPMWKTTREVKYVLDIIGDRAKLLPLLETDEAARCADEVLELDGVDEIHIGLNDLSISQGKKFLFELLVDGTVDALAEKCKAKGVSFGVGGVGTVGSNFALPAENIFAEHYRLGSDMVILSRSFCKREDFDSFNEFEREFNKRLNANRKFEQFLSVQNSDYFNDIHNKTTEIIRELTK